MGEVRLLLRSVLRELGESCGEGCGVDVEAMAMGLPVVLSDLSGASEMISSEGNGFLYPPGDVAALTTALENLMDAEARQNCGRISRNNVEQRFSLSHMTDRYAEIIWDEQQQSEA